MRQPPEAVEGPSAGGGAGPSPPYPMPIVPPGRRRSKVVCARSGPGTAAAGSGEAGRNRSHKGGHADAAVCAQVGYCPTLIILLLTVSDKSFLASPASPGTCGRIRKRESVAQAWPAFLLPRQPNPFCVEREVYRGT